MVSPRLAAQESMAELIVRFAFSGANPWLSSEAEYVRPSTAYEAAGATKITRPWRAGTDPHMLPQRVMKLIVRSPCAGRYPLSRTGAAVVTFTASPAFSDASEEWALSISDSSPVRPMAPHSAS